MLKKIIYTFASIFLLYLLLGFFALPYILKTQSIKYVNENLNAQLNIETIQFNPLLFTLHIKDLNLKHNDETLLEFNAFSTNFELLRSIENSYPIIEHITLDAFKVNPSIQSNKELNFSNLFTKNDTTQTNTSNTNSAFTLPAFELDKFVMNNSQIIFNDFSHPFEFKMTLDDINLVLTDIGTLKNSLSSYNLQANLNQTSKLDLKGGFSINDLKTYGTFTLDDFKTKQIEMFINQGELTLDNTTINTQIGFFAQYNQSNNELLLNVNNTAIDFKGFQLHQAAKKLLALETLSIEQFDMDFKKNNNSTQANIQTRLNINDGQIQTQSTITLEPLHVDLTYDIKDIALEVLNDLIEPFVDLNIQSLWINSKGELSFNDTKKLNYKGNITLNDTHLLHENETLVKANDIHVKNIEFNQLSNDLKIESVNINQPFVFVQIDKQSQLNFTKFTKNSNTKNPTSKNEEKTKDSPLTIMIGPVSIKQGELLFEDLNLPIPFKTTSKNLDGMFSQYATSSTKPSTLKLKGSVGEYGFLKIDGKLVHNNLKYLTNVKLDFDNIALQDLSSYSQKFVGRKIEEGKLSLHLYYDLKNSQLEAKNNIIVEQIQLGEKVQSEDAVNLPLALAIAILEDSDGVIDLNLPISGDVDNPEFSIAPIVWKAFTNLITKAITAPFSLLASLFDFDESEINSIKFEFAQSDITPIQKEPLDKIAQVLNQKPKLGMKFSPFYHLSEDKQALQKQQFNAFIQEQLKQKDNKEYQKAYVNLLETIYLKHHSSLKSLQKEHTQKEKLNESAYIQALKTFGVSTQEVTQTMLENLALKRVENIKTYLMQTHKVNEKQIMIESAYQTGTVQTKFVHSQLKVDTLEH
jgi:outer membrane protein OmpA-like peptidoglycan-associated protein